MSNISTYAADKLLDHLMGDVAYTKPTVYLALFTTTPTMPAGTGGVECSGGSYARIALAGLWSAAASGSKTNNASITSVTATASWGTVVGVAAMDAATAGNILSAGPLSSSAAINTGDVFQMTAGELVAALA